MFSRWYYPTYTRYYVNNKYISDKCNKKNKNDKKIIKKNNKYDCLSCIIL
jgi:hypothetical protein